jgi:hypothetical protein
VGTSFRSDIPCLSVFFGTGALNDVSACFFLDLRGANSITIHSAKPILANAASSARFGVIPNW